MLAYITNMNKTRNIVVNSRYNPAVFLRLNILGFLGLSTLSMSFVNLLFPHAHF